jgi:hypothetical protein
MPVIPASGGRSRRTTSSKPSLGYIKNSLQKQKQKQKRVGGTAQVVKVPAL